MEILLAFVMIGGQFVGPQVDADSRDVRAHPEVENSEEWIQQVEREQEFLQGGTIFPCLVSSCRPKKVQAD